MNEAVTTAPILEASTLPDLSSLQDPNVYARVLSFAVSHQTIVAGMTPSTHRTWAREGGHECSIRQLFPSR